MAEIFKNAVIPVKSGKFNLIFRFPCAIINIADFKAIRESERCGVALSAEVCAVRELLSNKEDL